jgi:hypothetical protein
MIMIKDSQPLIIEDILTIVTVNDDIYRLGFSRGRFVISEREVVVV